MSLWTDHVERWKDCRRCSLCEGRTKVVLAKGKVPCDVIFVGEAPGASEDVIGKPFVGPAGHLLDYVVSCASGVVDLPVAIDDAGNDVLVPLRMAFTNLVACIPLGEDGDKTSAPPKESVKACRPRLVEFIALAKPRLIVAVGALARDHLAKMSSEELCGAAVIDIAHPAAVLRANAAVRPLEVQRACARLARAFEELLACPR